MDIWKSLKPWLRAFFGHVGVLKSYLDRAGSAVRPHGEFMCLGDLSPVLQVLNFISDVVGGVFEDVGGYL